MKLPLIFSYRGSTIGNGFIAEVKIRGRVLADMGDAGDEGEETWFYGVVPSGLAESGRTLQDAHEAFREALRCVLIDYASDSESFDVFRERVTAFASQSVPDIAAEWQEAVERVRAAHVSLFQFPRVPADTRVYVDIRPAEKLTPELNTIESTLTEADAVDSAA
jgi:hypothetical protein